jgi:hypothetical protein
MRSFKAVECELPVRLVLSHDLSVPIHMDLQYEAGDPYAVRATFFPIGTGESVEWIFSRDMLAQALRAHAGHGDIRMWPAGGSGGKVLYIALSSRGGSALLEAPAPDVEFFLCQTQLVVARGAEPGQLDLDAELAHLLAGS